MGYIIEYVRKIRCSTIHVPRYLLLALMLALGLLGAQKCYSQEETELLRFIADGYEANLERLRTWKGTAIRREGTSPAQPLDGKMPLNFKEETVEQLRFVADRDKDAALWYGYLAGQKNRNSEGKPLSSRINSGMNKGEYHCRMDTMEEPELNPRQKRKLLIYSKDAVSHGFQNVEFDPVWVLIEDLGGHGTIGQALRTCAQDIEKKIAFPEGHGYKIERKGDVVTFKIYGRDDESEEGGISSSTYAFDISKGCSVVGQHHVSSRSETHWKLDYEEHNGVFVPKEITRVNRDKSMGIHHHIVFTTKMVNEHVSESEFSYVALGLRPGDYIIDNVKGGLRYQWNFAPDIDDILQKSANDSKTLNNKETLQPPTENEHEVPNIKQVEETVSPPVNEAATTGQSQQKEQKVITYSAVLLGILAIIVVGGLFLRWKLTTTREVK